MTTTSEMDWTLTPCAYDYWQEDERDVDESTDDAPATSIPTHYDDIEF